MGWAVLKAVHLQLGGEEVSEVVGQLLVWRRNGEELHELLVCAP